MLWYTVGGMGVNDTVRSTAPLWKELRHARPLIVKLLGLANLGRAPYLTTDPPCGINVRVSHACCCRLHVLEARNRGHFSEPAAQEGPAYHSYCTSRHELRATLATKRTDALSHCLPSVSQ